MPNIGTKAMANVFYQARLEASTHNEMLSSREGAAEVMAIDRGRLYRIENGVMEPYPEEVHLMADLYGAPQLRNHYCSKCCPLGSNTPVVEDSNLDRITVRALAALRSANTIKESLLDITADGVIDESERPAFEEIIRELGELDKVYQTLMVWSEKNLK